MPSTITNIDPPQGSRIELIESSSERLVLYLRSGGEQAKGIGCFAIAWNGIVGIVSMGFMTAGFKDQDASLLFIIPFLGLFWAIGIGMAYVWLRMKYTRTHLLLQPDRLTIQRHFFNKKWMTETLLNETSQAELVESYKQNDDPVYAVAVHGTNRTAKFATRLNRAEKTWLKETINRFLGVGESRTITVDFPTHCPSCGASVNLDKLEQTADGMLCSFCGVMLPGKLRRTMDSTPQSLQATPEVDPDKVTDERLHIADSSRYRLKFSHVLAPEGTPRTIISRTLLIVSLVLGVITAAIMAVSVAQQEVVSAVIAGSFLFPGATLAIVRHAILNARISVDLDADLCRLRWHWGRFGYSKTIATADIDDVRAETAEWEHSHKGKQERRRGEYAVCTIHSGKVILPVTTWHDKDLVRMIAGMLRFQLLRMGHSLTESHSNNDATSPDPTATVLVDMPDHHGMPT